MSAALSALGNMNESESSTTKSAISQYINLTITDDVTQKQKTGKSAEETLQALNRDVENANQQVAKQDLQKIQEKQEMAQVIGELSQAGITHLVGKHLEEANAKRAEADSVASSDPLKAAQLRNEAKAIEGEYGVGSNLQMGIRAATAALQGLATGNTNQAVVGALSPYANKAIKEATTNADGSVNKEANLLAHTILGTLEAAVTGNNAIAGGIGALTAEAAAPYIMKTLYGTDNPADLTDSQKQNVANISQITAGLAGGLVGDSTASGVIGAETGKRAVENNALTPGDVYRAVKEIKQAIKEGKSVDEVYEKYQKLSQEQRAELLADCSIDCRIPTEMLLNRATEMAEDYSGFFGGWLVGLPVSERERFRALVESENAITNQALDERKGMLEKGIEFGIETAQMFGKEHDLGNTKQNKKSLYDSQKTREKLENEFGKDNVKSTTVVLNPRSTISNRTLKSCTTQTWFTYFPKDIIYIRRVVHATA